MFRDGALVAMRDLVDALPVLIHVFERIIFLSRVAHHLTALIDRIVAIGIQMVPFAATRTVRYIHGEVSLFITRDPVFPLTGAVIEVMQDGCRSIGCSCTLETLVQGGWAARVGEGRGQ